MIDPKTAYVGMKVKCRNDGVVGVIKSIDLHNGFPFEVERAITDMDHYTAAALEPLPIPPTPPEAKRVEVVTETRTVVKEVWMRLSPEEARCFINADTTLLDVGTNMKAELKYALENANG